MHEQYVSDSEYQDYYGDLGGLRAQIAADLPIKPDVHVLEVGTGEGFFAIEVARRHSGLRVKAIDISRRALRNSRENISRQGLQERIEVLEMDATDMTFPDEGFDMAVNFAGLEDIHMTRGRDGVQKTFLEVHRVLKPRSYFSFVVMPPEEMETEAQKAEVALYSYICGATWLTGREYEDMLRRAGFELTEKRSYYTGKKLTPDQARVEIKFACDNVLQIYGIETRPFEEVWDRYGQAIADNGLGCHSKVVSVVTQKRTGAAE